MIYITDGVINVIKPVKLDIISGHNENYYDAACTGYRIRQWG